MRTARRPRRYIAPQWIPLLRPFFRYSSSRDAHILRIVGSERGPVLRADRRHKRPFDGVERRRTPAL